MLDLKVHALLKVVSNRQDKDTAVVTLGSTWCRDKYFV